MTLNRSSTDRIIVGVVTDAYRIATTVGRLELGCSSSGDIETGTVSEIGNILRWELVL